MLGAKFAAAQPWRTVRAAIAANVGAVALAGVAGVAFGRWWLPALAVAGAVAGFEVRSGCRSALILLFCVGALALALKHGLADRGR